MMEGEKSVKIKKQEMEIRNVEKIFEDVGKVYICDFWFRHKLHEKCCCRYKYKTFWNIFKIELNQMWYKVFYNTDITQEMQEAFLEKQKQN